MSGPITPPLTVTTASGSPSGRPITTIKVSDGDLTISGGIATIDTSGSGGTPGGSDTQVQYNNAGAFGGSADFTFTGIGGSSPTFTITNSGANTATLTQGILKLDGGTGGLAQIRSSTGDTGLILTAAAEALNGPFMLLDINSDPSQLLLKNGEEDGTIVIETDSGTGDITVNANGDLNLWGDSNSVNIRHQSGGAVDVVSATDTPAILQVKTVGDGVPSINLTDDTRAITLKCDANQKLKLQGGVNTFVFDASSATGGITWPDGTTQITAASGGGVTFPLEADAGSAAAPSYSFSGDTDTGIYKSASNKIGFTAGGAERMALSGTDGLEMKNDARVFLSDGMGASTPSLAFDSDEDTGIHLAATNSIGFGTAGSERFRIAADGQLGVGGANYGTDGQVLTSTGATTAPAWEDAGGGGSSYNQARNPNSVMYTGLTTYMLSRGVGFTTVGLMATSVSTRAGYRQISFRPFIAPETGDLTAFLAYVDTAGAATDIQLGIYDDDGGKPNDLMGTATIDCSSTGSKTQTTISATISLVEGTQYWYSWVTTNSTDSPTLRAEDQAYTSFTSTLCSSATIAGTDKQTFLIDVLATANTSPASITASGLYPAGNTGGNARIGVQY
ncbi:MAG: hypothetical protein GY922_01655 [Proteobacteria bacterium]|nr:hypothetical protein [Pseudomonadota bacterium]